MLSKVRQGAASCLHMLAAHAQCCACLQVACRVLLLRPAASHKQAAVASKPKVSACRATERTWCVCRRGMDVSGCARPRKSTAMPSWKCRKLHTKLASGCARAAMCLSGVREQSHLHSKQLRQAHEEYRYAQLEVPQAAHTHTLCLSLSACTCSALQFAEQSVCLAMTCISSGSACKCLERCMHLQASMGPSKLLR